MKMYIVNKFSTNFRYYTSCCEGLVELAGACLGGYTAINLSQKQGKFDTRVLSYLMMPMILLGNVGSIIVVAGTMAIVHTGVKLIYETSLMVASTTLETIYTGIEVINKTSEFITNFLGLSDNSISADNLVINAEEELLGLDKNHIEGSYN